MSYDNLTNSTVKVLQMPPPGKCHDKVLSGQMVSNGTTTPTKYTGGPQDSITERNPYQGAKDTGVFYFPVYCTK